jgi:hypothetical protein
MYKTKLLPSISSIILILNSIRASYRYFPSPIFHTLSRRAASMRLNQKNTATLAVATSLLSSSVTAIPYLTPRQQITAGPGEVTGPTANVAGAASGVAGVINKILKIIGNVEAAWGYDDEHPDMCMVWWEMHYDPYCKCEVSCNDGTKKYEFENCAPNRTSNFNDDRIGPFQITWGDMAYGKDEVYDSPILNVEYVNEGKPWDVNAIDKESKSKVCLKKDYINSWGDLTWNSWRCGVPKKGKSGGKGGEDNIDSNAPTNGEGYRPGECQAHIVHHTAVDGKTKFDVTIKDDNEGEIGKQEGFELEKDGLYAVASKLPEVFTVKAGGGDEDPITFFYHDLVFTSADQACTFGGWEDGDREGDCRFKCDGPPAPGKMRV